MLTHGFGNTCDPVSICSVPIMVKTIFLYKEKQSRRENSLLYIYIYILTIHDLVVELFYNLRLTPLRIYLTRGSLFSGVIR